MGKRKLITRREEYKLQTIVRKLERLRNDTHDMLLRDAYAQCIALCVEVLEVRVEAMKAPPAQPAPPTSETGP